MFGDTRDQISETEDEYENGIPTTWKASEDNVRKIGTNPWFQDMQQNYYKQLQYTIANAPEHKKLDVANQLSVDSTLSLLYGMTPTEAHENRNRLMYDIMGQQMDDKSWLQAFSDSFSSFDRNFVTSLKAYQLMFIKDPAKRVKLQQEIDDRNLKEATVYKDIANRNWPNRFVLFPGARVINQGMIALASGVVGGAIGTAITGGSAFGTAMTMPATTGMAVINGQLRDVSAKGALGWVLAKAGVPGIASSAGPQAIGSTIGNVATTVATMYPMATGQSYLEMKSYVDPDGNRIPDEIAVPFAMLAGFGETALEFLTQTPVTDRVMKGLLGRTMPNLHEASRYAWGTMFKYSGNVILDAAKSIHNESFEEVVQQFYDEFTYWVAKFASNQTNETRFDMDWKSDLWDIFKDGVKTYVQSLGPMALAAGGDAVLNLGMGANITRKMQAEADSMFADSKQGVAVDINSVFIGKHEMGGNRISDESDVNTDLNGSEKSDGNTDLSSEDDEYIRIHHLDETGRTKSADEIKAGYLNQKREPITVVQDERTGAYIPLNDSDKDVVSDLQNAGVGAVKVRVVSAKDGTMESSEYTGETVNRLALQLGASIAKDDQNTIVLPDQESVDAVAQDLRENETVYEEDVDTKTGGPVTLYLLDEDGKSVKITLSAEQELQTIEPDQKYIDKLETPHFASTMSLENYSQKRERDSVLEKVKRGMGDADPEKAAEMTDTILTVSGLTHIPSSTLADNIRVATNTTADDERKALFAAANARGLRGDEADTFVEKQIGKLNGWKENNGDGKYTIHLTRSATESTIVHEMGHIMRELLGNDADRLTEFESIYGKKGSTWVTDVVDNKDGTYSLGGLSFASYQAAYKKAVENEEKFANDFVRYMKEGVAPTEGLRDVFSRMKTILKGLLGIYAQDLDPAVRKAFEDLYAQNDREKAGGAGTGTLMESVEESDNPAFFRENQEALRRFNEQIENHDTSHKYKKEELYRIYSHTPLVLKEIDGSLADNPIFFRKEKVNRILHDHPNMTLSLIRRSIDEFSDPVAVFKSLTVPKSYVSMVTTTDNGGNPIIVPIHFRSAAKGLEIDLITGAYGKDTDFEGWVGKSDLLYIDTTKASNSALKWVQFPMRKFLASNSNIITRDQIVKKYGTKGTLFEPAASQAEYGETEERLRADPKNFDGEGRHLAPNGKPSRLTYRQWVTVRTPAFKAWFGDWEHDPENASKVVDENGEPEVVYHNTTENFSVFREGKNGGLSGNGIYFSEYPLWQFGPVQIQAFLDIRHPITSETELDGMHEINSSGLPTRFIPDVLDRFPQFDGVMNRDEMTVRSSNQVKSATDNHGTFDKTSPNIFFERATRMDISPDEDGERRVYALAEESRGDFERTVRGIAGEYSVPDESIRFRGDLKKAGRAREKVDGDYGGDWGRLLDVNGATIVFGDYGKAKEAYEGILRNHADIIARQKIKSTDFGYRDFTLNIRMPNGFIGELQLLDKAVFDTKNSGGHMIYEAALSLEKYNNHKDKYEELFGKDIYASIGRLYEDLKSWSVEVYSSSGFEYDKPGSSANLSATLRESNELSSLLRENMPLSRSVGSLSMTDLPSADGASTASKENPPSSVLMGISQISKYLTAIEDSYTSNISRENQNVNAFGLTDEKTGSDILFEPTQEENEQYTKEWYADVQKAVEEHFLVPDEVLEKFKGEDWADREMRFRATLVLPENQWWFEEAMAADDFDAYVDALNKKQTDEGKEPFDINLQEHSGEDYDWAKRIWDYAHLKSPVQKDREFVKNMTADRSTMISYAKTLRGYLVPQAGKRKKNGTVIYGQRYVYNSWPGVSTKVSRLTYSSTEEEVEAAKELVRANPHPYRRAFDYSVRQTQEAKETAAGGAYSSYGQEEYLENVGDNALDAWRAVERDAAKRELQKLREEKRNVKLGDLGVTDKTVKTVTEEEKKNPDIKDATAAKDATQEQATVKEATLTDKRLAKAKRKIKELKQTLADTEQELSATSDEYDDLLKSLGIADKESSDKIDFLKAYGKEKARQAKDLEEKLADRRNRVSELRSQLTDANEELRKTTSHSETLQNRLDTIKAKQVVAGLRSILKRVSSQNDSVDANVYDAFFLIHDRLLKDKGTGLVDIETDVLHYDYESAINQISYYVASTEGASHNIVNHLVDGDSLSAWTPQELADLASVLSDMRKDAQVSLARKKMERMQRLHDEAYVLYREITGQNGSLTYDDQMDVWLLNNDVVDNIKKKKDNALEGFSLAFSKMQRVARVVDGNREGVVYDRFVRKAWESNMQELRGVSKRLDAADKEMKRLKITDDWLTQEIYTYKSGATDVTLTRGQVIGLYVYSKNEVERAKLVAKQGNNISSADLASALALLSDNDKAWGDYMINDFAQNRERVADTYYQVYNRLLGWRENYFTMIGDGKIGDGEQDILDGPQQQKKRYVNKSMTKEIAERALYPLKLDVTQSWISQVRKEEHFVAFADWSRDSQHLLQGSGAMGTIIQTKYGKHMLDTFQHYTNDVGSPNTMMTNMEQTLNRVISRGAVAMLSYNLLTTIKQLPAVMAAFGQVGVGEFYKAGVELITDRKRTLDMIYEKAPDIRDRYISQDVQRAVETKAANKVDKVIKGVGEVGLQPVQFFDQAVATQLWYAAYLTNLNKGLSEQEAVFKASQLISETQNTNQVTDLSEIQRTRNPFTRSAFLFTNQTMQYFNFVRYDIGFYKATGQKGKMFGTVANILLNAGVMALVSGALLKRPSDDDDKDKWRRFATQYIGELLGQALPLVGSMIQEGMEGFSGSFISLFSSVGQMIKVAMSEDKGEGEKKERMKSSMKDLIVDGLAFAGAPATAGKRVILAISDSDWYYLFGTDWGKYGPGTFGNQE